MRVVFRYYPVMLALAGKKCVIVGGGSVAERKASALLESGAVVVVISPELTPLLTKLADQGQLTILNRSYERGDIAGAFLVYAASGDRGVNEAVCQEAEEDGALVNAADDPDGSSFIVPAVMNRGNLQIAVSTSGASPGTAVAIKEELEQRYGEEYDLILQFLSEVRAALMASCTDQRLRRRLLQETAGWDVLTLVREGGFDAFRGRVLERASAAPEDLARLMWDGLMPGFNSENEME